MQLEVKGGRRKCKCVGIALLYALSVDLKRSPAYVCAKVIDTLARIPVGGVGKAQVRFREGYIIFCSCKAMYLLMYVPFDIYTHMYVYIYIYIHQYRQFKSKPRARRI
jgi:hypothetical protein